MFSFFSILFGLTFQYSFDLVGKLFLSQIVVIVLFFYLFLKQEQNFKVFNRTIYIIGTLWLLNQIISDIFNESTFRDYTRGNIKIILTMMALYVFDRISFKYSLALLILCVLSTIETFDLFTKLNVSSFQSIWKFGLGITLTFVFLYIDYFIKNKKFTNIIGIIIFLIGLYSLFIGTRYLFLFNTITCYFLFQNDLFKIKSKKKIIFNFVGFLFLFFGIIAIYNYSFKTGSVDQYLTSKNIKQSSGDYGVFLGGRHEILSSYKAISDAPILGHGSWAKNCKYIDYLNYQLYKLNYEIIKEYGDCQIPSHSVILESWVNSGIFGFIFWFYILNILIKRFKENVINSQSVDPIFVFMFTLCFWDILFSPYGANKIILLPLYLVFLFRYKNVSN